MTELVFDQTAKAVVTELISQVNSIPSKDIQPTDRLIIDLLFDSVELIDLIMKLEEVGVVLSESDISVNLTVADIIHLVQEVM